MFTLSFNKLINNITKLDKELKALVAAYSYCSIKGSNLTLVFTNIISQADIDAVSNKVNNFVETDLVDYINANKVKPVNQWVTEFLQRITAENISMGITQAGKTADMLGFYQNYVLLPGKTFPITFKGTLDTGSLNVTLELVEYYLAHPELYPGLSPFIDQARLTAWKNDVIKYLQGV